MNHKIIYTRAARERDNTMFFCNYCLALANSGKFLSCLGLFSQYKKNNVTERNLIYTTLGLIQKQIKFRHKFK